MLAILMGTPDCHLRRLVGQQLIPMVVVVPVLPMVLLEDLQLLLSGERRSYLLVCMVSISSKGWSALWFWSGCRNRVIILRLRLLLGLESSDLDWYDLEVFVVCSTLSQSI